MSDIDVISRKDVLNMAYLSVFVDNDGHEVDEPRYVIDASDVERLSAAEQPMSAVEYLYTTRRMCIYYEACTLCPAFGIACGKLDVEDSAIEKAVAIVEKWTREHPERSENDE